MKFLLCLFLFPIITFSSEKQEEPKINCNHDATTFRCVKYIRNYDADTITVDIPGTHPLLGKKANVRVFGIDTPEIRTKDPCEKKLAKEGKLVVEKLLKGAKIINLINVQKGKYFRILADVEIDGLSLTSYLLKNKYGYKYLGKTKEKVNWCNFKK
jgi:endonuclease YncB( thermonuclease family)